MNHRVICKKFIQLSMNESLNYSSFYKSTNTALLNQYRDYHMTSRKENTTLIAGGIGLAVTALAIQYILKKNYPSPQNNNALNNSNNNDPSKANSNNDSWFASFFARNFYDGGFEDKMTRREAALILGVRESSKPERVKEAHRRVLLINHPDKGGSAYIAAKINEAKSLLLKGK
mmetsp:Transcript_8360/g.7485  ORF Transcript_8360/g.7485 Transcript_8360/m.7485 type:complete len:174 (-) Transcript_8360:26-547(-)